MAQPSVHPPPNNNLPVLLSSFVGRRTELAEVRQLIRTQRLVTLTGAGGAGKTRLALQVASAALPAFKDGVWLIELASLPDPSLVPQTVASVLGVTEQSGRTLTDTLADHLRPRHALLTLDNCEQRVQACAQLAAALLQACPSLSILATSREPLGVDGETVWSVPPLSLPDGRGQSPSASAPLSEAVQLFVARAESATPGFTLTEDNHAAVDEICRRLDGIPLAIELAAARLRALTVQQVAEHLNDRFSLLTSGSRTAPARHQTLQAALDWSYALLSEEERKVLERLSVFAGGCTLEAAEAVCSGEDVAPAQVLDLLSRLVDKSLLAAETLGEHRRFHLLDTIRAYAATKLADSGKTDSVRKRHLAYYVAWAEKAAPLLPQPAHSAWIHQFDIEHDNVRAALDWSLASPDNAQSGLRLAASAGVFWRLRGFPQEGRTRLTAALAHKAGQAPTAARADALDVLAVFKFFASDYEAVRLLINESLAIRKEQGTAGQAGLAWGLELLAEVEAEIGNYDKAFPLFEQALDLFRKVQDPTGTADTVKMMGWTAMRTGDYELADRHLSEGLQLCRQAGDRHHIASALSGLGELAIRRGQLQRAQALLQESLEMSRGTGDKWEIPITVGSLGWLALLQRDFEAMNSLLGESLAMRAQTGDRGGMAWCLEKFAQAAVMQAQYDRAATLFGAAAAQRAPVNSRMDAVDAPEYERNLAAVQKAIGKQAFEALWADAEDMPDEAVIAYALQQFEATPATRQMLKEEFGGLTERERETAVLIAHGKSNREIAEAMTVGVRTVETYVTRILHKLGLDSRVQIATWALEKGLAAPDNDTAGSGNAEH